MCIEPKNNLSYPTSRDSPCQEDYKLWPFCCWETSSGPSVLKRGTTPFSLSLQRCWPSESKSCQWGQTINRSKASRNNPGAISATPGTVSYVTSVPVIKESSQVLSPYIQSRSSAPYPHWIRFHFLCLDFCDVLGCCSDEQHLPVRSQLKSTASTMATKMHLSDFQSRSECCPPSKGAFNVPGPQYGYPNIQVPNFLFKSDYKWLWLNKW